MCIRDSVRADLPPELWDYIKRNGFFGLNIPKEYGGLGFSALMNHKVIQKLASISSVVSSTVGVPNSLGPAELLMHYGTEEQKQQYLPRLADGREVPCFALTGPCLLYTSMRSAWHFLPSSALPP